MKITIAMLTAAIALIGFYADDAAMIAIATALLGLGFAATDGSRAAKGGVTALSFFAIATFFVGVGDWVIVTRVASGEFYFLKYGVQMYYVQAGFVTYVGALLPHLGGHWALTLTQRMPRRSLLPLVDYRPRHTAAVVRGVLFTAIAVVVAIRLGLMPRLGKLTNVVTLLPAVAVFILSRWGYSRRRMWAVWIAFGLAAFLSGEALFYAYLRGQILFPWVALVFGGYAGRPKKQTFATLPFIIVYGIVLLFLSYFSIMGVVRQQDVWGMDRVTRLIETRREMTAEGSLEGGLGPALARRGTVNKVSQIHHLVARQGFYMGKSMEYYSFVFIPRFLWPGKPIIQKGGWFANEIGMGHEREAGRYSNAINMTIAGEWYLNFGWLGVILGCFGMGFVIMLFWQSTHFWESTDNIPGNFLAFILIKRCFEFMGPDMQSLIGYITGYLITFAFGLALRKAFPGAGMPQYQVPPPGPSPSPGRVIRPDNGHLPTNPRPRPLNSP